MVTYHTTPAIIFLVIFSCNVDFCQCNYDKETLKLVVTLFRHGDRTNDIGTTYPKNPYINETYYPYGYGELTNIGKKRMYNLGKEFRIQYSLFLGRLYLPGLIDVLSTDYSRTKNSAQLFLAGLFPPRHTVLEWNKNLNWNPISFNSVRFENNRVLSFPLFFCPKYQLLYEANKKSPKALEIENNFKSYYSYISQKTGLSITSVLDLFVLYFGLTSEVEWGLKLPKWAAPVYPDYLRDAAESTYQLMTATPELNQLFGGFLLKKTINDMYRKINNTSNQPKMYIYSGHELSVVSLLTALNLYEPHVPHYSACVIIELHQVKHKHYVKVRYNEEVFDEFVDMEIPGCGIMCPIKDFVRLVLDNLPGDGDPCLIKEGN